MLIQKSRIRSLNGRVNGVKPGTMIMIGARLIPALMPSLSKIGFSDNANVGDSLLPTDIGPITRFNSEGRDLVHRDQPMETAFTTIEWTWEQFNGPYDTETKSDFFDRPYRRYPRTRILPPSLELTIAATSDGQRILVTPPVIYVGGEDENVLHAINLMLEVMGYCKVYTSDLDEIIKAPLRRLNWHLLPSGHRSWQQLRPDVLSVIKRAPGGKQPVIERQLETINRYKPDFVAIGQAGFAGYVVFGFTARNLFVFESVYPGNATYVFGDQWENLSKLTKMQILENDLHLKRVIHDVQWPSRISALLRGAPNGPK